MLNSQLIFVVQSTGPDLHLTVTLDDSVIYDKSPTEVPEKIIHQFDDSIDGDHVLRFEMSEKLSEHTTISDNGEILQDRVIKITDVAFDDIVLGHVFTEISQYCHDHNGTSDPVTEKFYGTMGCNGRVEVKFSTPIYIWLLESM